MASVFIALIPKIFMMLFLLIDDIQRLIRWIYSTFKNDANSNENGITRSEFLMQTGAIVSTVPVVALSFGIISGAHDYRIRRKEIRIKNLPNAFNGIRILQISDIHAGSFWNRKAVIGGVELINQQKADLIVFTGDLVNNKANEMQNWTSVFSKIKADLGVYSILGNHDYGDYVQWNSEQAKYQNLKDLIQLQQQMGWDLLLDENRSIKIDNEKISLLGVQNWGAKANFPKYGNLENAIKGSEDISTKILLSHDPSHWRAQVLQSNFNIDLMLAGHTHGMQFGIETQNFKWSPAKYVYKEWAGLYTSNENHLYVNRGFGYLGYPGRLGIPPEITILTLVKG